MHRLPLAAPTFRNFRPVASAPLRTGHPTKARQILESVVGSDQRHASASVDPNFAAAIGLYDEGSWDFAFDRLVPLADQGNTVAARLVLLMLRYGKTVYGTSFDARPEQIARWAQRVLRAPPCAPSRATSRATASPSSMTASA